MGFSQQTDVEKCSDKVQYPLLENTEKDRPKRNMPHHNKGFSDKHLANITLNEKKMKAFPLKSEKLLCNIQPEVLSRVIRPKKELK